MSKTQLLIVDDELSIIKYLRANLEANGYGVISAMNGEEALKVFEMEQPQLVLLDITMPRMDGFEVCQSIREWSQVPIIMLSAKGDEADKVKLLELGADDYITKPFGRNELIARINAVLRRFHSQPAETVPSSICTGNLEINFSARKVTSAGIEVRLTPTEYNLLQELALNEGKVLTHLHLLNKIWGPEYREEKEYVHEFVRRLRNKLEEDRENPQYITSISGVGYQFNKVSVVSG